ncbi:MAG TPA: hypothetical protein VD766_04905 [Solirubrobacterales bacterium]|nr:hypothetical protein [Solirubrobacterales bacterium]
MQGVLVLALVLALLVIGAVALIIEGDVGSGVIGLLIVAMVIAVIWRPFEDLPPTARRGARLVATATVVAGWFVAGVLLWDWDGASYGVAGVVAAFALYQAATLPSEELNEDPTESPSGADLSGHDSDSSSSEPLN